LVGTDGSYEAGWQPSWDAMLETNAADWATHLACESRYGTWTPNAGANETNPINCVGWYDAAAFCIWDGGFLPSEAERFYAANGGAEQRVFPWSTPASSTTITNDDVALPVGQSVSLPVGSKPAGAGKYGQMDLAGNVAEWAFDYLTALSATCTDCAQLLPADDRVNMGGSAWTFGTLALQAAFRPATLIPGTRVYERRGYNGVRCARAP
jgi:formylglycine-generating enzyme required for sulfatase activity